ncbi:DNA polymerase bacteriophage-type (plasmid) [Ketogulonicigenium robustum]|uniref:Type-4 uracil-DNA glycosylase n=1 Tax=Ketogulonicigenium robustum TaxID=92947 RepID=A0A1W6P376_9RHOB|nr:UdgX family uracil-DNA binding protein [Ketogulonicigenium robustum]ARO15958.1 DNA polymerase bacteriophage-type [Ketogulonicigenium robustum]
MTYAVTLPADNPFEGWRAAARVAISHRIQPAAIAWSDSAAPELFAPAPLPDTPGPHQARVTPAFLKLARSVLWHSAADRFALLYHALWRIDGGDGDPLSQADPLGRRLNLMAKSVGRDIHKMHAFVRFRELPAGPRRRFAAWFEPEHRILRPASSFFAKRFADMDWVIATPHLTAEFTDGTLRFLPAAPRPTLPDDASEALWATYFANIFNPARVKLAAMRSEMPKKYWKNMPETQLIPAMLQDAEARVARMRAAASTTPTPRAAAISTRYRAAQALPDSIPETLDAARTAALHCRRCDLCEAATQTVWGLGNPAAPLMIVGEQPGDREDLTGQPFVGPAGTLLHDLMAEAALPSDQIWLTNAVKHFKFTPRGKQRLHQSPTRGEIQHCRWWLGLEMAFVEPKLVVALGASAAFALTQNDAPLTNRRGTTETGLHGGPVLITWHPAALLRQPDPALRAAQKAQLLVDLQTARAALGV